MTDRELLERAAHAAYYHYDADEGLCGTLYVDKFAARQQGWNPLEDDGDAFRLMVSLELNVFHASGNAYAMPSDFEMDNEQCVSYRDAGGCEQATRRAIVRAAAAMVDS